MKKARDNGMHEGESLEYFKRIVPRNPHDWEGGVVLYSTWNNEFYDIAFGAGGNLDDNDLDEGFNDYIMAVGFEPDGSVGLDDIITRVKNIGYASSDVDGLRDVDGMCWTLKHKDWRNGDIRRFLMEGLNCAGYGFAKSHADWAYRDIIYIGADYDVWRPEEKNAKNKKKGKSK